MPKIPGKYLLKEIRKEYSCGKHAFTDTESGEVVYVKCGRRNCPRCAPAYAGLKGKAIDTIHGKQATHLVLTVSNEHISKFATEYDYYISKEHTRDLCRQRSQAMELPEPARKRALLGCISTIPVREERNRIYWSSTEGSKAIRKIRTACGSVLGIDGETIGYARAVEFGEKNGRWHLHFLLTQPTGIILDAYRQDLEYNPVRKIYHGNVSDWKYGMIRIKEMTDFRGGLFYIAAYMTKGCPGRITFDKLTVDMLRQIKDLNAAIARQGQPDRQLEFARLGNEHYRYQNDVDAVYLLLKEKVKKDESDKRFFDTASFEKSVRRQNRKSAGA